MKYQLFVYFLQISALTQCLANEACATFMQEYDIGRDLAVATDFENLPLELPDVSLILKDIAGKSAVCLHFYNGI